MEKMKEITIEELSAMPKESFVLIDIRDEGIASYGMIPGAVNIPADKLESEHNRQLAEIPREKNWFSIARSDADPGNWMVLRV